MSSKSHFDYSDPDTFEVELIFPIKFVSYVPERFRKNYSARNKHPVYLLNTLIHPYQIQKIRGLGLMERLLPFDDLRKEGNKHFHLGEMEMALDCYEHAYGVYKYLEKEGDEECLEFRIICLDGQNNEENKIKNAALGTILNSIAITFFLLKHLEEARAAFEEALTFKPADPKILINLSKVRLSNLADKTYKESLIDIKASVQKDPRLEPELEKFYIMANARAKISSDVIREIASCYAKYHFDYDLEWNIEDELEYRIIKKMQEKYYEMIEFYMENSKPGHLSRIKEELMNVQMMIYKMNLALSIEANNKELVGIINAKPNENKEISPAAVEGVKRAYVSMLFTEGKFNEQLLAYCIEKCTEEDRKKPRNPGKSSFFSLLNLFYAMLFLFIALVFCAIFIKQTPKA